MRTLLLALAALLCVSAGAAQTKPEPPRRPVAPRTGTEARDTIRQPETSLPSIELPEYDITGKLIPGVENSGKGETGGNGALDPLGRGTLRGREGNLTDQGVWKEGAAVAPFPGARSGRIEAGYGSFRTPLLNLWVKPASEGVDLAFRGSINTTGGHVDNADERRGSLGASIGWKLREREESLRDAVLRATLSYAGKGYRPYGSTTPEEWRSFNQFAAGVAISDIALGEVGINGRVGVTSASISGSETLRHTRFGFEGSAGADLREVYLQGGVEGVLSTYVNRGGSSSPDLFRFTFMASREVVEELTIQAGFSGAAYRGSVGSGEGRLFPLASVSWFASRNIEFFVRFEPSVREGTLSGIGQENPYLAYSSGIRPEVAVTDLSVGAEVTVGRPLRVRFVTQLQRYARYLAFIDTTAAGLWETDYDGVARILTVRGDILWQMTEADLLTLTVRGNSTENSLTGGAVPYYPTLILDGGIAHWFSFGLLLSGDLRLLGSRTTDLQGTTTLDPALLASLSAEYSFHPAWRIQARCGNLFGTRYDRWYGYSAAPRNVSLSLSFSW